MTLWRRRLGTSLVWSPPGADHTVHAHPAQLSQVTVAQDAPAAWSMVDPGECGSEEADSGQEGGKSRRDLS